MADKKSIAKAWDESSAKFYHDMENLSKKPRFGLFNYPPSMVVGDNSYDRRSVAKSAKNFLTNPGLDAGVFSRSKYMGDEYEDPHKIQRREDLYKQGIIDQPFKPSDSKKTKVRPPYEYLSETMNRTRQTRDADGKVLTGPKNFLTKPLKKGRGNTTAGHLFGNYQYVEDPYDRAKELDLKEYLDHKRKMLNTTPFISNSTRIKTFEKDAKVYQWRPQTSGAGADAQHQSTSLQRGVNPFVVSKHYRPTTSSVEPSRKPEDIDVNQEEIWLKYRNTMTKPWRPNFNGTLERPTPSVSEKFARMHKSLKVADSGRLI